VTDTRALLLVGGYTRPRGDGTGISLVAHDRQARGLELIGTVPATSPSAVALSRNAVFAVEETDVGRVRSFHFDGAALLPLSTQDTGGADPCHLLILPSGRHLLTANYSSGSVAAHPIDSTGAIGPVSDLIEFTGCGPVHQRQDSSHAHHIAVRPGTDEIAIADLGADAVHRIRFDDATGHFRADLEPVRLRAGSGPRQIVFSADGRRAFVLGELDSTVTMLDWSGPGGPTVRTVSPALLGSSPTENLAATLLMSPDGRMLYASHRGADVVAVLTIDGDAVQPVVDIPSGGRWPRHIAFDAGWLYVANQQSGDVVALRIDDLDDRARIAIPSASFIVPAAGVGGQRRDLHA
jgi:6-phosphogluconolactonase